MKHFSSRQKRSGSHCVTMTAICTQPARLGAQKPANFHLNRLRRCDLARGAAFAMVLCLILPSSIVVRANGDQHQMQETREQSRNALMLDGKRLFYDQAQRQVSTTNTDAAPGPIVSDSFTVKAATDKSAAVVESQKPIIETKPALHSDKIYYHARIEGLQVIRIIINGLPCGAVSRYDLTIDSAGTVLNCNSTIAKRFQLVLLSDGVSIMAKDGKRVKGIITPGDSL